jgi:hypothetical protein
MAGEAAVVTIGCLRASAVGADIVTHAIETGGDRVLCGARVTKGWRWTRRYSIPLQPGVKVRRNVVDCRRCRAALRRRGWVVTDDV